MFKGPLWLFLRCGGLLFAAAGLQKEDRLIRGPSKAISYVWKSGGANICDAIQLALCAFYEENLDGYQTPEQISFAHISFFANRPVDWAAEEAHVLAKRATADPTMQGDPLHVAASVRTNIRR